MSDTPLTFHDYEFHFASGGPSLVITVQVDRDLTREDDHEFFFQLYHPGGEMQMTVRRAQLNAWQRTQRVEKPRHTHVNNGESILEL